VDDLHLLRERGGGSGVAWSGPVASHAWVRMHTLDGRAALAGDDIAGRAVTYIFSPPPYALVSRRWQTCHLADFFSRS